MECCHSDALKGQKKVAGSNATGTDAGIPTSQTTLKGVEALLGSPGTTPIAKECDVRVILRTSAGLPEFAVWGTSVNRYDNRLTMCVLDSSGRG